MSVSFEVTLDVRNGLPVFKTKGYIDAEAVKTISASVQTLLDQGTRNILLDFAECVALNSPGIAQLLDLTLLVQEDFQGKVIIFGANNLNRKAFAVSGIDLVLTVASDFQEAANLAK